MGEYAYQLLLVAPGGGETRDVTQLVQSISWAGSIRQTARQMSVSLAIPRDGSVEPPALAEGAALIFRQEESDLQAALQPEVDALRARLEDIAEQLELETATWGLDLWEEALGLTAGRAMGLRARRARIAGKLRGAGTSTVEAVRQVVESFTGGEAQVMEHAREFRVELRFRSERALDLSQLSAALREILPAHLVFGLAFTAEEARHILGWGTAAGIVGALPGAEQKQNPPPASAVYAGGSSSLFLTVPGQNAEEA